VVLLLLLLLLPLVLPADLVQLPLIPPLLQMILQPNGASFAQDGMLGVGYVRTPLGKTASADDRNFWTLVFGRVIPAVHSSSNLSCSFLK